MSHSEYVDQIRKKLVSAVKIVINSTNFIGGIRGIYYIDYLLLCLEDEDGNPPSFADIYEEIHGIACQPDNIEAALQHYGMSGDSFWCVYAARNCALPKAPLLELLQINA